MKARVASASSRRPRIDMKSSRSQQIRASNESWPIEGWTPDRAKKAIHEDRPRELQLRKSQQQDGSKRILRDCGEDDDSASLAKNNPSPGRLALMAECLFWRGTKRKLQVPTRRSSHNSGHRDSRESCGNVPESPAWSANHDQPRGLAGGPREIARAQEPATRSRRKSPAKASLHDRRESERNSHPREIPP